jgi:hypothetical protein
MQAGNPSCLDPSSVLYTRVEYQEWVQRPAGLGRRGALQHGTTASVSLDVRVCITPRIEDGCSGSGTGGRGER